MKQGVPCIDPEHPWQRGMKLFTSQNHLVGRPVVYRAPLATMIRKIRLSTKRSHHVVIRVKRLHLHCLSTATKVAYAIPSMLTCIGGTQVDRIHSQEFSDLRNDFMFTNFIVVSTLIIT